MAYTQLFTRLQRLFSSDVVIRNIGGNQIKVIDTDRIQSNPDIATNSLVDRYSRLYRNSYAGLANPILNYQAMRIQLYSDYEIMDTDAIVASALDIIADESTLKNEQGEVLHIKSPDENLQKILYNLFYDVLNIEFNLWSWIRNTCKYGDFFLKLDIAEQYGIYNVKPYSPYDIVRKEGQDPTNPSYIKFEYIPNQVGQDYLPQGHGQVSFENYEMVHFRLLADYNYLPFGRSFLEPGRRTYKQMVLLEDAAMIHRIMRAPEKRVFYINVGSIPPNEIEAFMQKTISKMKKTPHQDERTGEYNLKFNMQNMTEDFYIPVRGNDSSTKIDTTKGLEYTGMEDVAYIRDKLFAALKVPKAFMGYEKDLEGKCIDPETKIPLLDGRILSVKELIDEFNAGKKNYVYSLDEVHNNIVPGEIEWAGFTRLNAQTIKVWLDNDKYIRCTPDHKFLTREGIWKEAQHLIEGESLMPLYLRESTNKKINGYTEVYNPYTEKYEFTHRMVANHYGIKQNNKVIHHIDCNKKNNNPENLDGTMDFWEHRKWHVEHAQMCHTEEANTKRKATMKLNMENEEYRDRRISIAKENSKYLVKWIKENGASRKGFIKNNFVLCKNCKNGIDKTNISLAKRYNLYCSEECKKEGWKSKYKISKQDILDKAPLCKNFKELKALLNIKDHMTLSKAMKYNDIEPQNLIIYYMPLAHNNLYFMNQFPETNAFYKQNKEYKNHKVLRIEKCDDSIDTCDLTIAKYHNFGTEAGVIIHNSTLAAQDIRFARTVERIQRIILSELTKIAVVHLYSQGYDNSSLVNFELSLTTPSIIYDQEKVALLKEKAELANTIIENNLISSDWVLENVFHFSEDECANYRAQQIEDAKRAFRLTQIKNEGNDPVESGQSYGTPHDLAALYGTGRYGDIPEGYDEKEPVGRPKEKVTDRNTQQDNFGKDRVGIKGMKDTRLDKKIKHDFKGGSPLALETYIKSLATGLKKKQVILNEGQQLSILDERNIREIKK